MQRKNRSAKRSAIFSFEKKKTLSYLFLLLSVGLRGEVDPRESLPLKSPSTAPVFRYIVRLAFASVKHNVLVRVHVVKRGFTRSPRVQAPVPPTPFSGGLLLCVFSSCLLLHFGKDFRTILDTLWGIIFSKNLRNDGSSAAWRWITKIVPEKMWFGSPSNLEN